MRVQRVRKRDGREVAYDRRKIEGAVSRAEGAAGELRPGFSAEIAELVERLLERRFPDPELAVPGIEDIQDLVERALVEMGAAAVAKAYILYRDKRAQIRAALLVRDDPSGDRGDARDRRRLPRVENKDGVQAWSKGRIVAALMSEADLPRSSAEEVASRVEARVFAGGSTSISTALVRELVDNELVELGLEGALRRQRPIGVPRHDLRRTLLDAASIRAAGGTVEEAVSGEVLSRYAMEDLLPAYVADRVRAGDLDFEDLARPHLPLALAVPTDVLRGDALLGGEEDGARLLPEIAALSRCVSRGLAIEGAEPLIAGLARSSRSGAALPGWLAGLAGVAQASGRSIEIVLDEPRPAALEALLDALGTLARGRGPEGLPTVVLSQADWSGASAAARESAGRWIGAGLLVPSFGTAEARYAGPGLARAHGERATRSLAAVALVGLPRLARRAGAWREDAVFEGLVELLEAALDGLEALRDFQRETRDPAQPRARATFGIAPVGLREALAILGDGEPREEQAGRLVAFLREASERLSRSRALDVDLCPVFSERAAERFARLDAAEFRVRQPWLFARPDAGRNEDPRAYGVGLEIPSAPALLAALGAFETAALRPASALQAFAAARGDRPRDEGARRLEAWETLHRLRGRSRGTGHPLYALPPVFRSAPEAGAADPDRAADLFAAQVPGVPADS